MGRTIRRARERQHLTQGDLAQRVVRLAEGAGVEATCDRSTVAHWERGTCRPGIRLWPHVASALGLNVEIFHMINEEAA